MAIPVGTAWSAPAWPVTMRTPPTIAARRWRNPTSLLVATATTRLRAPMAVPASRDAEGRAGQAFLELLASGGPADAFVDVVRRAQARGVPDDELARLERLANHAINVRATLDDLRRRERELRALYA